MTRSGPMLVLATGLLAGGCATTGSERELSSLKAQLQEQQARCAAAEAKGVTRGDDLTATSNQLASGLQEEIKRGQVTIHQLRDQLRLSVVQELLFDSGHAELRDTGQALLDKVAQALEGGPARLVTIEGHTDNVQIGPSIVAQFATNWELSTARATTVVRYLQEKGVAPQALGATGFGEYRPVSTNETAEGRQLNRRIEVVLTATPPTDVSRQASAAPAAP
jgi:chemotaxis protein MotB